MEGDGIVNVTSIKHLSGQGKISFRSTDGVSKTIPVETVHVEIGHELIINGTVKNVRQITGDGTLVLTYFDSENTKNDLSAIDQVARASNFKGTLGFQLPPIQDYLLDFSQLKENNFPYIIAPRTEETTKIRSIKLRLEQYKNATISWPERYVYRRRLGFILVVSDPSAGKAIVPAFPEDLSQFTLLNTDGSPIDCTVEYGTKTNTLTWAPTTPRFAELPDDVNQMLARTSRKALSQERLSANTPWKRSLRRYEPSPESMKSSLAQIARPRRTSLTSMWTTISAFRA